MRITELIEDHEGKLSSMRCMAIVSTLVLLAQGVGQQVYGLALPDPLWWFAGTLWGVKTIQNGSEIVKENVSQKKKEAA